MNEDTLVSVHCYGASAGPSTSWEINQAGDAILAAALLPCHERLKAPIVFLSPIDAPVRSMGPHICRHAGKRAYIGQDSLDRQIVHLQILLEYPFRFYLLNDADSFCVSADIPKALYEQATDSLWSNLLAETRPHQSKYPKFAAQPPYFLTRESIEKILVVAPQIRAHEITPYIDWAMVAWACEAGLKLRAFSELENPPVDPADANMPHESRYGRILNGAVMVHPIKSGEGRDQCLAARKIYEQSLNRG